MQRLHFIKKSHTISTQDIQSPLVRHQLESSTNPLRMLNDPQLISQRSKGFTDNIYALKPDEQTKIKELRIEELNKKIMVRLQKAENLKKIRICNRIAFIKSQKQKQNKTLEANKNKLQQLTQIKTKDKHEKELLNKTKTFNQILQESHKKRLIHEVKQDKKKRKQSLDTWKSTLQQNAQSIRRETLNNQTYSHFYKLKQQQKNYNNARKVKISLDKSRRAISERNHTKIQDTKKFQKMKLTTRIRTLSQQKKQVKHLQNILTTEIINIRKWDRSIDVSQFCQGHQIQTKNQSLLSCNPEKNREFRSKSVCLSL